MKVILCPQYLLFSEVPRHWKMLISLSFVALWVTDTQMAVFFMQALEDTVCDQSFLKVKAE